MTSDFTMEPRGPGSWPPPGTSPAASRPASAAASATGTCPDPGVPSRRLAGQRPRRAAPGRGRRTMSRDALLGTKDAARQPSGRPARSVSLRPRRRGGEAGSAIPWSAAFRRAYGSLRPVYLYSHQSRTSFVIGQRIARRQAARIEAPGRTIRRRARAGRGDHGRFPRPEQLLEARGDPGRPPEKVRRLHGLAEAAMEGSRTPSGCARCLRTEALAEVPDPPRRGHASRPRARCLRGCGVVDELPAN